MLQPGQASGFEESAMQTPLRCLVPLLLSGAAASLAVSALSAQSARPAAPDDAPYSSRATAILVDVVVRDHHGRPVLDLKADDFQVFEDDVPQRVGSFTLISQGTGIGVGVKLRDDNPTTIVSPTGEPVADAAAPQEKPVVALVFDALSPETLSMCQQAALRTLGMNGETNERIGVFESEPTVHMLQGYTTDTTLVRQALFQLSSAGAGGKDVRVERMDELRQRLTDMDARGQLTTALNGGQGAQGGAVSGQIGQAEVQRRTIEGEIRILRAFDDLDRDHRGYGTSDSLLAILQSMAFMPGRKSLVLFSEGMPASPALQSRLQSVIESANRSNISVYAVDANGLRIKSEMEETQREVKAAADERLRQAGSGADYSDGPLTKVVERTEDMLRYNGSSGLARLASDTGGILIRGTNNIDSAFRRIAEDQRFHYLLTYTPTNDVMDGTFRTITVKVRRPDVDVFARKGYRAVRAPLGMPVLTYEAPALALLDRGTLPNAFPSQASSFAFPEPDRPGLTPVVVRVTTDALRFQVDEKRATYSAQAAIVVRVRDAHGQIVHKLSQQYVLTGDADELDAAKKGEIIFYREPDLDPGIYEVESIVYDAIAEKGSARVSTVTVPKPDPAHLRMSSLVLVDRTEKTDAPAADASRRAHPPFYYGDLLLYPNLGGPLQRESDSALSFYFVVYPPGGQCDCSARISLLRNGAPIAEATRQLPSSGEDRLQHVGNLPIADLPAGTYELRITVLDGHEQQTRTAFFTVRA
jgi:VWFA-related protein